MMQEEQFRRKVTWFSFSFSLLVIWVHSYNAELYLGKTPAMEFVYRLEYFWGDGIGQIAVPGFFMISGYLFYRDFSWKKLGEKWQRRIRSVLTPYILWNFLYYLGYVIASRLPWLCDVVGKGVIPFDLYTAVDAVINYTYNYVFWYLFQLILLILSAPLLYPILKRFWTRVIFLCFLWCVVAVGESLPLVNADALIYYTSAASMAFTEKRTEISRKSGLILLIAAPFSYYFGLRTGFVPCFVLCRLAAVAGLWIVVPGDCLPKVREFMKSNFFLYGVHFALVRFINKAGARLLPAYPAVPLGLYLAMPFLVLAIATALGKFLQRYMPAAWNLLSGGR